MIHDNNKSCDNNYKSNKNDHGEKRKNKFIKLKYSKV